MSLPLITRRFDESRLTSEFFKNDKWQVIFKIRNDDGVIRDYCRESLTRDQYEKVERVEAWAIQMCLQHRLHGAEIQLF